MATQLWRIGRVMEATGLARGVIYRLVERGEFPRQVKLTERTVAWPSDEVEKWISDRIESAREEGK